MLLTPILSKNFEGKDYGGRDFLKKAPFPIPPTPKTF